MGRNFLKAYRWLESHPGLVLTAGLAVVGAFNLYRWGKDKQAATRLAAAGDDPLPAIEHTPRVSFLVPAWNEAQHIQACLGSIHALRYPHKELVVCAGGEDGSYTLAKRFEGPEVIVLKQQPGEGKQGALRRCFAQSTGEVIFLTDADCLLDDECVEKTMAPILNEGEGAVTGYWQPFEADRAKPLVAFQWANHLRYQGGMGMYVENLDGRNSVLTREALIKAGAFRNEAAIGTDYVLSRRLRAQGYRIRSVLASRVQTEYPLDPRSYLKQGSRWYRNRLVQGYQHRQWADVITRIWVGLTSLFIFSSPVVFLMKKTTDAILWKITVLQLVLSQVRLVYFMQLITGNSRRLIHRKLLGFMCSSLLSNLSIIYGLISSFSPNKNKEW